MISFAPIWAVVLRHTRMWRRDPNYLLGGFYWPLLDILTWGWLGIWIQQSQATEFQNYEVVALLGVLLWQIVGRGSNLIIVVFSEEIWSQNLVNIFSLPLRTIEYICGAILFFVIMMTLVSAFCLGAIYCLYDVSFWYLLKALLIFAPPLLLSTIWLGFTCLQIITVLGKRGIELGFVIGWFLLPFSGAYYPIEVLPQWGQTLSKFMPLSHVFQGMRGYLVYQQDPTADLVKGYVLGILYAICAIVLFAVFFKRSKQNGLAQLIN